jgi:hypothetical protein
VEVYLHAFLTSILDGDELSVSRPCHFTPREIAPVTHWIWGWVGPRAGLDRVVKRKISSPRQDPNPDHPPCSSALHHWAIPAPKQKLNPTKYVPVKLQIMQAAIRSLTGSCNNFEADREAEEEMTADTWVYPMSQHPSSLARILIQKKSTNWSELRPRYPTKGKLCGHKTWELLCEVNTSLCVQCEIWDNTIQRMRIIY